MKVIVWNCRGLGNPKVRRNIKELCRMYKPDVLCLLETRSNSAFTMSLPNSLPFEENHRVPSDGYAGGLWLFWSDKGFSINVLGDDRQFIHTEVAMPGKEPWVLSFAYVRPNSQDKTLF